MLLTFCAMKLNSRRTYILSGFLAFESVFLRKSKDQSKWPEKTQSHFEQLSVLAEPQTGAPVQHSTRRTTVLV